ncbi:MAG TPA: hypothetical protein VFL94_13325 [Actinomycetales bacterium]|nr:hypothetical protein [Actinomycetales bacterium]
MARRIAAGVGTVWVRPKDGGIDMVSFSEGDEVPDWAAKQMGDHCFADLDEAAGESTAEPDPANGDSDDQSGSGASDGDGEEVAPYTEWTVDELKAEIDGRNAARDADQQIEVGGKGNKPDLVEALEADDEAADESTE